MLRYQSRHAAPTLPSDDASLDVRGPVGRFSSNDTTNYRLGFTEGDAISPPGRPTRQVLMCLPRGTIPSIKHFQCYILPLLTDPLTLRNVRHPPSHSHICDLRRWNSDSPNSASVLPKYIFYVYEGYVHISKFNRAYPGA